MSDYIAEKFFLLNFLNNFVFPVLTERPKDCSLIVGGAVSNAVKCQLEPYVDRWSGDINKKVRPAKGYIEGLNYLMSFLSSRYNSGNLTDNEKRIYNIIRKAKGNTKEEQLAVLWNLTYSAGSHQFNPICTSIPLGKQLKTILKSIIRSIASDHSVNTVLFLGRDAWLFAVMAALSGKKRFFYDSRASRVVAGSSLYSDNLGIKSFNGDDYAYQFRQNDLIFDTGFEGSIHKKIQSRTPFALKSQLLSSSKPDLQLWENFGLARNYALAIEYLPKFFKTGGVRKFGLGGEPIEIIQEVDYSIFLYAVLLTIYIVNEVSPKIVINSRTEEDARRAVELKNLIPSSSCA